MEETDFRQIKYFSRLANQIIGFGKQWTWYNGYTQRKHHQMVILYGRLEGAQRSKCFLLDQVSIGILATMASLVIIFLAMIEGGISIETYALLGMPGMFIYLKDIEVAGLQKKNEALIRSEYPVFLLKLILLMNAGMPSLIALKKINRESIKGNNQSPLYRYLNIALLDIDNGITEGKAIEAFGKYCRIPEMSRFSMIYIQAIKKGGTKISDHFQSQMDEALKAKKRSLIEKGEQASTKLLLPMGIQLIIILALVMIPAFASINI